jgi:hypothetical protein
MKNIISTIFVLAVVLVSCDQDNIGTVYEPEKSYVAFSSPVVAENKLSAENNFSVSAQIVRSDLNEATTATVELEMNDDIEGVFALQSSTVTFNAGEGKAYAKIIPLVAPAAIDPTKSFKFELTLTGDNVSDLYNTTTYTANVKLDYTNLGTGNFVSQFYEEEWPVELLTADLGNNVILYKAKNLYGDGYDVVIVVNGSNVTVSEQPAWYYDDEYGDVYVTGEGTISGKVITLSLTHFIPDVYAWDAATEVLTLP